MSIFICFFYHQESSNVAQVEMQSVVCIKDWKIGI